MQSKHGLAEVAESLRGPSMARVTRYNTRTTSQRARRPVVCFILMLLDLIKARNEILDYQSWNLRHVSYKRYDSAKGAQMGLDSKKGIYSDAKLAQVKMETEAIIWVAYHCTMLQAVEWHEQAQVQAEHDEIVAFQERLIAALLEQIKVAICDV